MTSEACVDLYQRHETTHHILNKSESHRDIALKKHFEWKLFRLLVRLIPGRGKVLRSQTNNVRDKGGYE